MPPDLHVELKRRPIANYNYVKLLTKSELAWEYLRRNRGYRKDWRLAAPGRPPKVMLSEGTELLRLRCRHWRAEAWGLCLFR